MRPPFLKDIDAGWTLFLDRDGVINRRIVGGYVQYPEEFVFLPGVPESIAVFSVLFGRIIVVTNQQGIGKGLMNEKQLETVHRKMLKEVEQAGGRIDAVLHCPDLAGAGATCRKPSPFLALEAQTRFPEIDFRRSIMVGDAESDMLFGKNAGMYTVWVGEEPAPVDYTDFVTSGLPSLAAALTS
jgi:histidinol-phosphate phosphatase family protein